MNIANLSPLAASALVGVGGAGGALARYQLSQWVTSTLGARTAAAFPWATLGTNIIGSLAMGGLLGWLARGSVSAESAETIRLLIGVGLLGGFTTFSAFSAELVTMLHRGQIVDALLYGSVSLIAGMAAIVVGLLIAQSAP